MAKYKKPKDLTAKIKDWPEPKFSEGALGILEKRYLMKDDSGRIIETPKEMLYRVAHVIASADRKYGDFNSEESEKIFYNLMVERKFLPNSPTLRGAGLDINLAACYVIPIGDSREEIFIDGLYSTVEVQAFGGGTGFNFSKLRPKGSLISTTRGESSGVNSFVKLFDLTAGEVIAQGGTRHGANMAILNCNHGDIEEFIEAKNKEGILNNFNISIGVTEEFMKNVKKGEDYPLINHKGKEIRKVNAKKIFDEIVRNAWEHGDPGMVFLDRIDRDNPTPALGRIESTNPCGEQPLLPFEACNIGSINLRETVKNGEIDYEDLKKTVYDSIRYLDNVIDVCKYPLEKPEKMKKELWGILEKKIENKDLINSIIEDYSQSPIEKIVKGNRKIGLGVMGFSDMLIALGIPYGSEESYKIAEKVMSFINEEAKKASIELAKERGPFPNFDKSIYKDKEPIRNATRTTIAPTGTLSTLVGTEGGIEPLFGIAYLKRAVYDEKGNPKLEFIETNKDFEEISKKEGFYSEQLIQEIAKRGGSLKRIEKPEKISEKRWNELKEVFVTAHDLSVEQHVSMQATFQKCIDNAVSKTINLPHDATLENVREAYLLAYEKGLKGITIYRDGSMKRQVRSTIKEEGIKNGERPKLIGTTIKQKTPLPNKNAFVTLNVLKKNVSIPYEAFTSVGKGGKDVNADAEAIGRLASLVFKLGGSLEQVVEQLEGIGGGTQTGAGKNKISSLADAISKGLLEAYSELNNGEELKRENNGEYSGDLCDCGGMLKFAEGCQVCQSCGYSKC